jgi:hypothetical protein
MTCDYNGWNDSPEAEREWFDQHPEIWGGAWRVQDDHPLQVGPATPRRPCRVRRRRESA